MRKPFKYFKSSPEIIRLAGPAELKAQAEQIAAAIEMP
jgi:hypothetical protein